MTIHVMFFGLLAHDLGIGSSSLELSDNARVKDAILALSGRFTVLQRHAAHLATAVNLEYVGLDHVLHNGDELALIPPVSGG